MRPSWLRRSRRRQPVSVVGKVVTVPAPLEVLPPNIRTQRHVESSSKPGICKAIDSHGNACQAVRSFRRVIAWHAAAAAAFFDGLSDDAGPRIRGSRPSGAAAAASQQLQDLNAFSEAPRRPESTEGSA